MELRISLSDKVKALLVLSAAALIAAAILTYMYWSSSDSTGMYVSFAVMVIAAALVVFMTWNMGRVKRAELKLAEPLFFGIESGPKHPPIRKEEAKPVIKTKMPDH